MKPNRCFNCNKTLQQPARGRKRRYCSLTCKLEFRHRKLAEMSAFAKEKGWKA